MGSELLWLHVGQCGVQVGKELWKLLREDHRIGCGESGHYNVAFELRQSGLHAPRNLCVDTDPTPIFDISKNKDVICSESHTATGTESSGSLYPRGMLSSVALLASDRIRTILEESDRPGGAVFFYGSGGGTGSGLTAHISGRLFCDCPKLKQLHFVVSPNPGLRASPTSIVESYNVGLMASDMCDLNYLSCIMDNDALYHISGFKGKHIRPDYSFINKILSMAVVVASSGWRFSSCPSIRYDDLPTNLVISPKMKFSLMSLSPVLHHDMQSHQELSTGEITRELFQLNSYLARCDPRAGAMAACISYRGQDISAVSVAGALRDQAVKGGAKFVSWVKPTFKVGITGQPLPPKLHMYLPRAACMLTNTRAVVPNMGQVDYVFNTMLRRKAFLHWYLKEGAEFADFLDASDILADILELYKAA